MTDIERPHGFHKHVKETLPTEEAQFAYDAAVARLEKLENDIDSAIKNYFTEVGISKQSAAMGLGAKKTSLLPTSGKIEDLPSHEELFEDDATRYKMATLRQEAAILHKQLNQHKETLEEKKGALADFREKAQEKLEQLSSYSLIGVQARAFGLWIKSGVLEGVCGIAKLLNQSATQSFALLKKTENKIAQLDQIAAEIENLDIVAGVMESKEAVFIDEYNQSVHGINSLIDRLNSLQMQLTKIHQLDEENKELTKHYHAACQEVQPYLQSAGQADYLQVLLNGHQAMEKYDEAVLAGKELSSKELLPMLEGLAMSIKTLQSVSYRPQGALWQMGSDHETKQQKIQRETLHAMQSCYTKCQESLQTRLVKLRDAVRKETIQTLLSNERLINNPLQHWKALEDACVQSELSTESTEKQKALYKEIFSEASKWKDLLGKEKTLIESLQESKTAGRDLLGNMEELLATLPSQISSLCSSLKKEHGIQNISELEISIANQISQLQNNYSQRTQSLDELDVSWLNCKAIQQAFVGFAKLLADIDPYSLEGAIAIEKAKQEEIQILETQKSALEQQLVAIKNTRVVLEDGPEGSLKTKMEQLDKNKISLEECKKELETLKPSNPSFFSRLKEKVKTAISSSPSSAQIDEEGRLKGFIHYFETRQAKLTSDVSELQSAMIEEQQIEQSLNDTITRIQYLERKRANGKHWLNQLEMKQMTYELFTDYKENLSNYQDALSQLQSKEFQNNKTIIAELKEVIASLKNQTAHSTDPTMKEALTMQIRLKQNVLYDLMDSARSLYSALDSIRLNTETIFTQLSDCTHGMKQLFIDNSGGMKLTG